MTAVARSDTGPWLGTRRQYSKNSVNNRLQLRGLIEDKLGRVCLDKSRGSETVDFVNGTNESIGEGKGRKGPLSSSVSRPT